MVMSASEECHESQDLSTGNGGSSLCVEVELASWFATRSSGIISGGDNIGKFEVLSFRVEIQDLALIGCS
jgi:hypothetical protein